VVQTNSMQSLIPHPGYLLTYQPALDYIMLRQSNLNLQQRKLSPLYKHDHYHCIYCMLYIILISQHANTLDQKFQWVSIDVTEALHFFSQ